MTEHHEIFDLIAHDPDGVLFFDIETDSPIRPARPSLIGWMIAGRYSYHLAGASTEALALDLASASVIVTFNGKSFDVPTVRTEHPRLTFPDAHLDLMHLFRRHKLTGGLKQIETQLGIMRPTNVIGLSGKDAPRLWRLWQRTQHARHLDRLVDYNRYDVTNLALLLDHAMRLEQRQLPARCFCVVDSAITRPGPSPTPTPNLIDDTHTRP